MLSLPRAQVLVAGKETKDPKTLWPKREERKKYPFENNFSSFTDLEFQKIMNRLICLLWRFLYQKRIYQSIWGFFTHPTITPFPNLSLLPLHRADKRGQTISDFHRIREDPSSSVMWQFLCLRLLHFPSLQLPKPPALRDP